MTGDRRIFTNARMGVLQVVVTAATLFVVYRYLLEVLGPDAMGIWSIVFASVSVGRLADFGVSASLTLFVARAVAHGEPAQAVCYVRTGLAAVGIVVAVIVPLLYLLALAVLPLAVPPTRLAEARALVPYALVALYVGVLGSILQGAVDGTHRVDVRSRITIGSTLLFGMIGIVGLRRLGLRGLAMAQIIQATTVLGLSWLAFRRELPVTGRAVRPSIAALREMAAYGLRMQVITIFTLLWEPATKFFLARWGGLSAAGWFEAASRLIQQLHRLIAGANQALVPSIVDAGAKSTEAVARLYQQSYRVVVYLALIGFGSVVAALPLISRLWLGTLVSDFVRFAALLAVGWFANVLSGPGYFVGVGTGDLRWNIRGHVVLSGLNIVLGWFLGARFGADAVVVGAVVALVVAALIVIVGSHRQLGRPMRELIDRRTGWLAFGVLVAAAGGLLLGTPAGAVGSVATTAAALGIISLSAWTHPVTARLWGVVYPTTPSRSGASR